MLAVCRHYWINENLCSNHKAHVWVERGSWLDNTQMNPNWCNRERCCSLDWLFLRRFCPENVACAIQMGTGGPDPLENYCTFIGFLSNAGPDPLKNHKATKPAFNVRPSSARQQFAISIWNEPSHEISNNVECATSKADHNFASRLNIPWVLSYTDWTFL